jgi:ABC-2 type transport system ATP-binding protein
MICDRVAIIVGGQIHNQGRLSDLIPKKILFTEVTVSGVSDEVLARFGRRVSARTKRPDPS